MTIYFVSCLSNDKLCVIMLLSSHTKNYNINLSWYPSSLSKGEGSTSDVPHVQNFMCLILMYFLFIFIYFLNFNVSDVNVRDQTMMPQTNH